MFNNVDLKLILWRSKIRKLHMIIECNLWGGWLKKKKLIHTTWWSGWGRVRQNALKWHRKSCLPTDFNISSAPEKDIPEETVLYRYLSQPAASLGVDFPKHLADCTRIYSWFAHRLAPQKLLLRLITKGAWSIHLERVSVGVCLSGMKLRVYCDWACSFAPGAFTLYETSVT